MTYVELPTNFGEMLRENPAAIISGYCQVAGMDRKGPWTTNEVLRMLIGFGLDCDVRHLNYMLGRGVIESPRKFGAALAWRIENIQALMLALDDSRRWIVGFHQNRKTPAELERDVATVDQAVQMLEYFETLEEHELKRLLAGSTSSPNREWLVEAIRAKQQGKPA
jgi:hypothetical protein